MADSPTPQPARSSSADAQSNTGPKNEDAPLANKNPGNFANNPERARAAGRKGGQNSGGNFKNNPKRAREAGRKGGQN